jgi:hypothetical protein
MQEYADLSNQRNASATCKNMLTCQTSATPLRMQEYADLANQRNAYATYMNTLTSFYEFETQYTWLKEENV